jgi:integrase
MSDKRVTVWVQRFADRKHLMLQWLDPDTGKRKSKSAETDDEEAAEKKRADLEYELNHGLHQEPSKMTWEGFRELFEAEYVAGRRRHTRMNYVATFDLFEKLCSPSRLRSITERTVSQFVACMRKEPGRAKGSTSMMPSTIKVRLQFLHTALSWGVEQKLLTAVPKFPVVKVPKKNPQPVPGEAFEKMLAKAPDAQMRAYLLCGWLAGLRLNEALTLEWGQNDKVPWLDFPSNRIWLPAEFVKADRDQWLPLDKELRQALEGLTRRGKKVFCFRDRGGQIMTDSGVSQLVRKLARKAGVRLTMKSLRRGFGCRHAGKVSAHVLQRLMRHANIKTTLDYYANIDDAVEQAILGTERNTSCNSQPSPSVTESQQIDVNSDSTESNDS